MISDAAKGLVRYYRARPPLDLNAFKRTCPQRGGRKWPEIRTRTVSGIDD
jgi:hypothetical protein